MTRPIYRWAVETERGEQLASGERYAHNAALDAATSGVRAIARQEDQSYRRAGSLRLPTSTEVRWVGERDERVLLAVVRRPS